MPLEMPVAQVKLPTTFDQVLGSCPLVLIGLTQMKKEQPISAAAFSGRFAVHHSRRPSLSTAHRSRRLPRETRPFCRCKALSRRRARAKSSRLPLALSCSAVKARSSSPRRRRGKSYWADVFGSLLVLRRCEIQTYSGGTCKICIMALLPS